MFIIRKFIDSSKELGKIQTITICAMMLALRVILGILSNSLLPVLSYVKVGLNFLPITVVAILYGPVCAGIVSGAGDILSIILLNPTGFSINPGITLCCVIEGLLYGVVLYHTEIKLYKVIIAKAMVLFLCNIPLNTLFLSPFYPNIPLWQLMLLRAAVLVPMAILEVVIIYYVWKLLNNLIVKRHIKV